MNRLIFVMRPQSTGSGVIQISVRPTVVVYLETKCCFVLLLLFLENIHCQSRRRILKTLNSNEIIVLLL